MPSSDTPNDGNSPRGLPTLRFLVKKVCKLLVKFSGLYAVLDADYPTVATALRALTAACVATGFDQPDEKPADGVPV